MRPRRHARAAVLLCVVASLGCDVGSNQVSASEGPISLGCELAGVHLKIVPVNGAILPVEADEQIQVTYQERRKVLRQLGDLQGLVRITSTSSALQFVRFLTSPATWYAWSTQSGEVEIVSIRDYRHLPTFGVQEYSSELLRDPPPPSGWIGVLSRDAYRAGAFRPPRVRKAEGGFTVVRWTYSERLVQDAAGRTTRAKSVQQIREYVGVDGGYRREVMKEQQPPDLPGTMWTLAVFL